MPKDFEVKPERRKQTIGETIIYIIEGIMMVFYLLMFLVYLKEAFKSAVLFLLASDVVSPILGKFLRNRPEFDKSVIIMAGIQVFVAFSLVVFGIAILPKSELAVSETQEIIETEIETLSVTETETEEETTIEPQEQAAEPTTETEPETIPETTETPTEAVTEPENSTVNLEIYNQNGIKITYTGITDGISSKRINLTVENNSDKYYGIIPEEIIVNGTEISDWTSFYLESGETDSDYITIFDSELSENELKNAKITFYITDDDLNDLTTAPIMIDFETNTVSASQENIPSTEPKKQVGKNVDELGLIYFGDVRNDVTGNWRYSMFSGAGVNFAEYAVSYYDEYMSEGEIHAVVNTANSTTIKVTDSSFFPDEIYLTVYSYVDGEEHDAKLMFGGNVLAYYTVNKETGEITEE